MTIKLDLFDNFGIHSLNFHNYPVRVEDYGNEDETRLDVT